MSQLRLWWRLAQQRRQRQNQTPNATESEQQQQNKDDHPRDDGQDGGPGGTTDSQILKTAGTEEITYTNPHDKVREWMAMQPTTTETPTTPSTPKRPKPRPKPTVLKPRKNRPTLYTLSIFNSWHLIPTLFALLLIPPILLVIKHTCTMAIRNMITHLEDARTTKVMVKMATNSDTTSARAILKLEGRKETTLIDSGAEVSLATMKGVNRLNLGRKVQPRSPIKIYGLGEGTLRGETTNSEHTDGRQKFHARLRHRPTPQQQLRLPVGDRCATERRNKSNGR